MRPLIAAALLLLPIQAFGQATPAAFACPTSIEVEGTARIRVPEGFVLAPSPMRHWLRGATLFDGPPAELASLRPNEDARSRRDWWDLDPANPRRYHIICRYEGIEDGLEAMLPADLRRCTIETRRENARAVRGGQTVVGQDRWIRVTCTR